jgi:hypothetical protein
MRILFLAGLLCVAACGDDTSAGSSDLSAASDLAYDMTICVPGTGTAPCPSCMPRSGDSCPVQLIMQNRSCSYGSENQVVCLCGGEATWSCNPAGLPLG